MNKHFWQSFSALALPVRNSQRLFRLRGVGKSTLKLITCFVPLTFVACAGTPGYIEVPSYKHYYFYAPRVAVVPPSGMHVKEDSATIDLAFEGSGNALSITTMAPRGDQGFIQGSPGKAADYTGVLAVDAATANNGSIPMRLWVAASCTTTDWIMLPSKIRLVDAARNSSGVPLSVYLQPAPAVLHPDQQVLTARWQYTELDANREMRCQKGDTIAFTAGFEMTLSLSSLRVHFADSVQEDDKALRIPDVDLSLTAGGNLVSTKRTSILEILLRTGAAFAR